MKKEDFVKLLDSIIERKIKSIVPKMIKEELKNMKPVLAEKKLPNTDILSMMEEDEPMKLTNNQQHQQQEPVSVKTFMKNPVLNALLNETAQDMKKTQKKGSSYYDSDVLNEYKNTLAGEYNDMRMSSDDMTFASSDIVPMRRQSVSEKDIKTEMLKQEVAAQTGNPNIANAMIKDYSKLLKAVDKKTKSKRPM